MEIGDVINGYTVITPIGQGGAGIVYDVQKGSAHYALKECTDIDEESLRRFARELRIAKALNSPNIVKVKGFYDRQTIRKIYVADFHNL